MSQDLRLSGLRFRRGESVRVDVVLRDRVDDSRWRGRVQPVHAVEVGDRLRFGAAAEGAACLLGFVDADIVALRGDELVLAFHFAGPVLDEALLRFCRR